MIAYPVPLPDTELLQKNVTFSLKYQYVKTLHPIMQNLIHLDIPLVRNDEIAGAVRIINITYIIPEIKVTYKITSVVEKNKTEKLI